jgi:hypothetical protein
MRIRNQIRMGDLFVLGGDLYYVARCRLPVFVPDPYASIRQHTSAYVSISLRQHTSAYISIRQHTDVSIRQHTSAYRRR